MRPQQATYRLAKSSARFLGVLLFLAIGVALLPMIVAGTGLRDMLVALVVPREAMHITTGGASLGWFSPPVIRDVHVYDSAGQPLLTAGQMRLTRTPLQLWQDQHNLGRMEVTSPVLYVTVRGASSNWEEVVRALDTRPAAPPPAEPKSQPASDPLPAMVVHVTNATVQVNDATSGRTWQVDGVEIEFDSTNFQQGILQLSVAGRVAPAAVAPIVPSAGQFSFRMGPAADGRQMAELNSTGVPLTMLQPWLARWVQQPELAGQLTMQATAAWAPVANWRSGAPLPAGFVTSGIVAIDEFAFASRALAGDHVQLARVELPWQMAADQASLKIDQLALRSELGQIDVSGTAQLAELATAAHNLHVHGNVSLAKLAAQLPHALKVRDDVRITSGELQLSVRGAPAAAGGQRFTGTIESTDLAANTSRGPLRWDRPLRISFDTSRDGQNWLVDMLTCEADFCRISASGDSRQWRAAGQLDLDRLHQELGQFVDLSEWQPTGTADAELSFARTANGAFQSQGTFRLDKFALSASGRTVWTEPQLTITGNAAGSWDAGRHRPSEITTAAVGLRAGGDSLDASLTAPVQLAAAATAWPVAVQAVGDAGRWLRRARPWLVTDQWQVAGKVDLAADVTVAPSRVECQRSQLTLTRLRATSPEWKLDEPRVELSGDWAYNGVTRRLASEHAQFVSSSASLALKQLQIDMPEGHAPRLVGAAAVRADLVRLSAMHSNSDFAGDGMVTGNLEFRTTGDAVMADLNLSGQRLALLERLPDGPQAIWREPQATATARAILQKQSDRLELKELRIQSNTLSLNTNGTVDQVFTRPAVNVTGTVDYDLAQVTPLLKPYVGDNVQLVGREQARFQINGPLSVASRATQFASSQQPHQHWAHDVTGRLEVPWQGASLFGLPVGKGQLAADLQQGTVRIQPLSVSVGQGRLQATPSVQLDPPPEQITLPREQVLANVDISREVSDAMLKFIAPVLADATRSQGVFSMQVEGGRVPLAAPRQADVAGQLTIHTVDVLPGPSTEKWVRLAQQVEALIKNRDPQALVNRPPKTILTVRDRSVPFRLVDGRVYHEQMEFYVGEVVVRSRGSVGLDESLELMLDVPVLDKWIDNTPLLAGLRGQTVQIPVTGSLSRPKIDARAVTALSTRLLSSFATEALGGEVNKALEKLFGR